MSRRGRERALPVSELVSGMDVTTVHLMTRDGTDPHPVLDQAHSILQDRYHITHATLQVEPDTHQGCSEVAWIGTWKPTQVASSPM